MFFLYSGNTTATKNLPGDLAPRTDFSFLLFDFLEDDACREGFTTASVDTLRCRDGVRPLREWESGDGHFCTVGDLFRRFTDFETFFEDFPSLPPDRLPLADDSFWGVADFSSFFGVTVFDFAWVGATVSSGVTFALGGVFAGDGVADVGVRGVSGLTGEAEIVNSWMWLEIY